MSPSTLARTLFDAIAHGDEEAMRSVCASSLEVRQNSAPPATLDWLVLYARTVRSVMPDLRYEQILCQDLPNGFVEEHSVCGTLPDGSLFSVRACVVGDVSQGRITRLREYADSAAAAGLARALGR